MILPNAWPHREDSLITYEVRPFQGDSLMYSLSPATAILDITMGKLSKFRPQVPFTGWKAKTSYDGERSHSEKDKYVGPYDNSPVPRLTIHSFIMGVFVRVLAFSSLPPLRNYERLFSH